MSEEPHIVFRGMRMLASWPERIRQAQLETTCRPNGIERARVRFGGRRRTGARRAGPATIAAC